MKIIVAKTAGFCMGVKRAVDLALEHSGKARGIFTSGPLIHNRQTTDILKQRGVSILDERKLKEHSNILIRAHGVPPETQDRYRTSGHSIIDGTCPKVKTVHKVIERYRNLGYMIVITGDKDHAEVIGLMGYAADAGHLIQDPDDVDRLPDAARVCLVSQTTFDRQTFRAVAEKIRERYAAVEVVIKKTICAATDQRQEETERLAKEVDAMIVVGGKDSANTQRLAKISREAGALTQHVETEEEIDWDSIASCKTLAITAGASTPTWMIKRVYDYIQFMGQTSERSLKNSILTIMDILTNLNVFVSIGAILVYYASCVLQGFTINVTGAALSFLYFMSMYLWNSLANITTTQHLGISRFRFYSAHKRAIYFITIADIILALLISAFVNKTLFYLMIFALLTGTAYHITIVPPFMRRLFRYNKLSAIPTSRDLFVALAWGTLLTFIPQAMEQTFIISPAIVACFCWFFILGYLRSLIFDLRDIEGDRIMGRETLITIVGEKRARKAIYLIIMIFVIGLLLFPAFMGISTYTHQRTALFLFQVPALLYTALFVRFNPHIRSNRSALFNLLADGIFYLAGIGALVSAAVMGLSQYV